MRFGFVCSEMKVTEEELRKHRVHQQYWDFCAHLLIPLEKCRK